MKNHIIQDTKECIESFLRDNGRKLTKKQKVELSKILDKLERNAEKPNKEELWAAVVIFFKLALEGAEILKHLHEHW